MMDCRPGGARVVGGAGCSSRLIRPGKARWDSALHLRTASGFTLLEMVAAIAIGAILLVTLGGVLSVTVRGTEQMRGIMRQTRLQAGVERVLRRDMEQAFRAGDKGQVFIGQPQSVSGVVLEFTSQSSFNPGVVPPAGLVRVEYSLVPSVAYSGTSQLRRREMTFIPGKPLDRSKADPEPLADGVTDLSLSFYDGTNWTNTWLRDTLPALVKLNLRYAQDAADPKSLPLVEYYFAPCVDLDAAVLPE